MRRLLLFAVIVALLGSAGCFPDATPQGAGPLRYRDQIFDDVDVTSNVVYGSAMDQQGQQVTLVLDMYLPRGDTNTRRPAIVWVHGGGFSSGTKTSSEIVDEATTFAKKGYVTVSINYRLYPPGCSAAIGSTPGCVQAIVDATHDAQAAVRFLRANFETYGVDTARVAMGGTSAGGIISMQAAYNSDDSGTSGNNEYWSAISAGVSLSGAYLFGTMDYGDAPTLLFHGTSDVVVPYAWAETTVNLAHDAHLTSYLTSWAGDGHVPYANHRTQILTETTNFLYWMMGLDLAVQ